MLDSIADLKARWFELYPDFPDVRERWLTTVKRWEWANGPRYDPRPFYFQRDTARGRLLRHIPAEDDRSGRVWKCGYDELGRNVVTRSLSGGTWETFCHFTEAYIELVTYQLYYHALRGVSCVYFESGRPSYFLSFTIVGDPDQFQENAAEVWKKALQGELTIFAEREDYRYSADRLTLIERAHWHKAFAFEREKGDQLFEMKCPLNYDSKGDLEQISCRTRSLDFERVVYRKRQSGETLLSLAENTKQKLVEAIPKVIQQAGFSEPLYCLQLQFLDENFFPPILLPGFESKRQRVLETMETLDVPGMIWASVSDFDEPEDQPYPPFPIEDEETLLACERLQIEVEKRGNRARFRLGRRTLRAVAKALNQLDWSAYAPVTPDFIVFAYDQEDLAPALRLSGATSDQIADWRQRGLLP